MPNRPSSPRDPLRRGGAAGLVDLWTTQRSVAHKLHNANNSSKRKRTNDVLSKPDKSECYRHADGGLSTFEKWERWHGEGSAHYA
jgi:hypothetical protein